MDTQNSWRDEPATKKQLNFIERLKQDKEAEFLAVVEEAEKADPDFSVKRLTKGGAGFIISRLHETKSAVPPAKAALVNPTGEIVQIDNLVAFCAETGLDYDAIIGVVAGRTYQHEGWTDYTNRIADVPDLYPDSKPATEKQMDYVLSLANRAPHQYHTLLENIRLKYPDFSLDNLAHVHAVYLIEKMKRALSERVAPKYLTSAVVITTEQALDQLEQAMINLEAAENPSEFDSEWLSNVMYAQAEILRELAAYFDIKAGLIRNG